MDIIALIASPQTCHDSLRAALAAAEVDRDAAITALHFRFDPTKIALSAEEIDVQELRLKDEGTAEQPGETRAIFDNWAKSLGDRGKAVAWREVEGDNVGTLVHNAGLITISRPQSMEARDALHAAVFDHHRLVLFVPPLPQSAPIVIGASIAIAWNDDAQVRHCLAKAEPWLRAAGMVHVLAPSEEYFDSAIALLAESGVTPVTHVIESHQDDLGTQLLEKVHRLGADCLLMGAYRHGEFLQTIFGGVTRTVMDKTDLPIFFCH